MSGLPGSFPHLGGNARASVVNRTHRVVREKALDMRAQRQRSRSLWVPLAISSVLVPLFCYATWGVLDGYDLTPNGMPDASDQMMIMAMWMLPVTLIVVGIVWFRRTRMDAEVTR